MLMGEVGESIRRVTHAPAPQCFLAVLVVVVDDAVSDNSVLSILAVFTSVTR